MTNLDILGIVSKIGHYFGESFSNSSYNLYITRSEKLLSFSSTRVRWMRMTANILKIAFLLGIFTIIAATSASSTPKSYSQFYDPLPEFTSDAYEDHHRPENSLKKHVLFVSIPLPGHVNPLLAQAAELAEQGFTVTVATPDTLRDYILKVKDDR